MEVKEPEARYLVRRELASTRAGVTPEDWTVTTVGEVVTTSSGTTPPRAQAERYFAGGTIPWVKTLDLNNSEIAATDESVTAEAVAETSLQIYPAGCVVLAMYGGLNQIGRTGILQFPATVNQALTAIRPDPALLDSGYLLRVLNFRVAYWQTVASSSRKDPNITGRDVRDFPIALPPIKEQRAIAQVLCDTDALIESLEQLLAKKRQIKQGAMQELLTGQRRLPGFQSPWLRRSLGTLAEMRSGATPSTSNRANFASSGTPWVSIADLTSSGKWIAATERSISQHGLLNCAAQIYPAGSVLYAMYASLGECSIAKVSLTSSQAILGVQPGPALLNEFLYHHLQWVKPLVKGMGQQGTQANLNKGMVQRFQIALPILAEQTAIAATLSDMDAEIAALQARLAKARQLKQGMMQALLTGRIRLVPPQEEQG